MKLFNFCIHKFGKVTEGYQYCEKCGKAIEAPKEMCEHAYGPQQVMTSGYFGAVSELKYIDVCTKCGNVRVQTVS